MTLSVLKNSRNWNFANFRNLILILPVAAPRSVLKNCAIFTGKHLWYSLFLSCNFIKKETLAQGVSRTPVNDFIKTEDYIKLYIKHKTIDLFKLAYTIYSKNEAFRE